MSIMTSSAPSSESYETCLSEFTQSGSGSLVGISQSESTHFEVLPDSPTLGTVDGEVLGEVVSPLGHVHSYYSDPESDQEFDEDDDKDTYALANRIRLLIQTLASRSRSMPGVESSFLPQISERIVRDSVTGQPMPFADAAFLSDTELIAKLKNTLTMNGVKVAPTCGKRKGLTVSMTEVEKKSVWAILDSFKAPPAHHWCADLPEHLTPIGGADGLDTLHTDSSPTTVISDDSSIMMCFPLVPVPDSKVELTKFSVVTITQIGSDRPKMKKLLKKYRMFVTFGNKVDNKNVENSRSWKFWKKKGTSPQGVSSVLEPNVVTPEGQPTFTSKSLTSLASHSNLSSKADVKQRVWVPSTTNMSVQALWWGYRM
ncbi:hypothetical protein L218DRAFT_146938 [Marasmius fiardii PR-910]|nr:hypothetical protein L218DRAFT_146938 [Marasmius fiardii PR-910]